MPQRAAQHAHVGLGPTGPGEEPVGRQTLQPLAIEAIGCGSAGDTLGLAGSAQEHLPAPGFSQCKHRNPVDPGRCHGDGGDATVEEPVGQSVEGSREGAETAHGLGVASRGTAPQSSASPMSMPAAWGWETWRASESLGDGGSRGGGTAGPESRKQALWGAWQPPVVGHTCRTAVGSGRDREGCSLPNGIRTGPVTSAVVASPRPTSQTGTQHPYRNGHDDWRKTPTG